ncbi:hypothetical protein A0J61_10769 [Choanephora cucurbitarum]|uniref:Uncharacterized protein n=1 Tax=Choanephora cucurbitarum TaxID=101091 RepID=A0A1C7MWJ3_9FUNG|nr:hypothetical protein A0J61_10769 [Choanephora cucurbitarum]
MRKSALSFVTSESNVSTSVSTITSCVANASVLSVEDQNDDVEAVYDLTVSREVKETVTLGDCCDNVAHWSRVREIPLMNGGVFFETFGTVEKC